MNKIVISVNGIEKAKKGCVPVLNANKEFDLLTYAEYNEKLYSENLLLKQELNALREELANFKSAVNEKFETQHNALQILLK